VAVYGGHIRANRIHDSQSWCLYVKGGSSYLLIEGNLAYNCGEGGITAGQGTGFEFMDALFLRYEANYIKIVNNLIHDITGAALGVNGGYNILIAHNTAYKVGMRSHLLEVIYGERTCDGDSAACLARQNLGGWGPTTIGFDGVQPIGNKNVMVLNNVLYNPAGIQSADQHFAIYGPRTPNAPGIPSPQRSDDALVIKGNIIWNGTSAKPLGIEGSEQGCQSSNLTCTASQILAENFINTIEPDFISAISGDFRPIAAGALSALGSVSQQNFGALEAVAGLEQEGNANNQIVREFSGALSSSRPPGAIVSASSSLEFSAPAEGQMPPADGDNNLMPSLKINKVLLRKKANKIILSLTTTATDPEGIESVSASLKAGRKSIGSARLKLKAGKYIGQIKIKSKSTKVKLTVVARDVSGLSVSKSKNIKLSL
jgi:hypothetical protein